MVSRLSEINKYGGYTWDIEIDKLFHIFIHSTEVNSFICEFKEFKFFRFKTHFTFVSNEQFSDVINESFDKVFVFFEKSKSYTWTNNQKEYKIKQVIEILKKYDPIAKELLSKSKEQNENSEKYFKFESLDFEIDLAINKQILTFYDKKGESRVIEKGLDFDMGSILLVDSANTINDLIKDLPIRAIYFPENMKGMFSQNDSGEIFIKGWNADEFVRFQLQESEKHEKSKYKQEEYDGGLDITVYFKQNINYGIDVCSNQSRHSSVRRRSASSSVLVSMRHCISPVVGARPRRQSSRFCWRR